MPKLMAMAKTTAAVRDGIRIHVIGSEIRFPDASGAMNARWSSFYDIRDGRLYKDVTRRDGWLKAKAGDVVELTEWPPRVGPRWVCSCGVLGSTKLGYGVIHDCPLQLSVTKNTHYRTPQRLGLRRIVSAHRVRLGDIDAVDLIREGFPGMNAEDFVKLYCFPKRPEPNRVVTRIVLERI